MFVKHKMEELKQSGVQLDGDKNNNGMFTMAVGQWKNMSDQAKADYTAKFKARLLWLSNQPAGFPAAAQLCTHLTHVAFTHTVQSAFSILTI